MILDQKVPAHVADYWAASLSKKVLDMYAIIQRIVLHADAPSMVNFVSQFQKKFRDGRVDMFQVIEFFSQYDGLPHSGPDEIGAIVLEEWFRMRFARDLNLRKGWDLTLKDFQKFSLDLKLIVLDSFFENDAELSPENPNFYRLQDIMSPEDFELVSCIDEVMAGSRDAKKG